MKKIFNFLFECESKVAVFLLIFYLIGFIIGCSFIFVSDVQAFDNLFADEFLNLFLKNLFIIFLIFLFGFTAFGVPVIAFIIMYSGICIGIVFEGITVLYGFKGLLFAALILFLYNLFMLVALINVSFSSLRLSLVIFNSITRSNRFIGPDVYAKAHILKFLFFSFVIFICSAYYIFIGNNLLDLLL